MDHYAKELKNEGRLCSVVYVYIKLSYMNVHSTCILKVFILQRNEIVCMMQKCINIL